MSYYFRTEKLSVGYEKKPLIENIDVTLKKGEILTLIGPNGAGKSTILKSIARQLTLVGGAIYLDEKNVGKMSGTELSQNMAVVFTERLRAERMTCEDVVETGRYPYTGTFGFLSEKDHAIVEEALRLVHAEEIRYQSFSAISDGQRQRIMLARAICQEPEIIILDEPTSYLDIRYKLEFFSILQELQKKRQLTVIMSLHELDLAERISNKILCVKGRYVDRYGTPEEVFEPGYLSGLFGITEGSFDEKNGNLELPAESGTPEVFVLAGGGVGRAVYRRLQRQGISFVTGILYENDLDYPTAKALAVEVIAAKAFEPISARVQEQAQDWLQRCERVICCRRAFGTYEQENAGLLEEAKKLGKNIEWIEGKAEEEQWQK